MSQIFISYSQKDRRHAEILARALETEGWSVWWDVTIPTGKVFDDVIEEALHRAQCVCVLWSKESVASRWVRTEAEEGAARNILVPVMIERVQLPLAFRRIQTADLVGWKGLNTAPSFRKLVGDIAAIVPRERRQDATEVKPSSPPIRREVEIGGEARVLDVRVHRAFFSGDDQECHFVNLANLSPRRVLEVTHVWYEDETHHIPIIQPSRPLPVRLELDQSWETWIESSRLPSLHRQDAISRFRARISTGSVFASRANLSVPPTGIVPGGPIS